MNAYSGPFRDVHHVKIDGEENVLTCVHYSQATGYQYNARGNAFCVKVSSRLQAHTVVNSCGQRIEVLN